MITMDVKGINWVRNIYQKFENMCLEAEDMICEDAVKYIENQMQTVGESVKRLYSEVMQDLSPPSCDLVEKVASELHVDQYTDVYSEKPFLDFKEKPVQEDTKQISNYSRIDHGADNNATHAASNNETSRTDALFISSSRSSVRRRNCISHSRHHVENVNIKTNFGIDENTVTRRLAAPKIPDEITLAETDACRSTSQSCELFNENRNHVLGDSNPTSAEVTRVASLPDCWNGIEDASTEQYPSLPAFTESAQEKQMNASSSSDALFGKKDGFSTDTTIQSDICSNSMVFLSHPGHESIPQDHLKLEETCVMVTGDELKLVPKAGGDVKTSKKKKRKGFSLSKKSARKQEYEELAMWHGKSEKVKGDCEENADPASMEDQKKLLSPCMSEPEWELI